MRVYLVYYSLYINVQYESVPLGRAAKNGHTQTVQRLLEAGANINYQNKVISSIMISLNTTYNTSYCQ